MSTSRSHRSHRHKKHHGRGRKDKDESHPDNPYDYNDRREMGRYSDSDSSSDSVSPPQKYSEEMEMKNMSWEVPKEVKMEKDENHPFKSSVLLGIIGAFVLLSFFQHILLSMGFTGSLVVSSLFRSLQKCEVKKKREFERIAWLRFLKNILWDKL